MILEDSRMWVEEEDEEDDGFDDLVWFGLTCSSSWGLARLAIKGKAQPDVFPSGKNIIA